MYILSSMLNKISPNHPHTTRRRPSASYPILVPYFMLCICWMWFSPTPRWLTMYRVVCAAWRVVGGVRSRVHIVFFFSVARPYSYVRLTATLVSWTCLYIRRPCLRYWGTRATNEYLVPQSRPCLAWVELEPCHGPRLLHLTSFKFFSLFHIHDPIHNCNMCDLALGYLYNSVYCTCLTSQGSVRVATIVVFLLNCNQRHW